MTREQLRGHAHYIDRNFRVLGADKGLERNLEFIETLKQNGVLTRNEANRLWNHARARRYGNPIDREFARNGDHI